MAQHLLKFGGSSVAEAARVVKSGGLIVYPTDTVYGLGCDPMNESALAKLFRAKRREAKPVPILCDCLESASRLAFLSPRAVELARSHWPGGLTIVAPMRAPLPESVHQGTGAVGVRVPDHPLCIRLIAECGGFLTGTSANLSGRGPCRRAEDAERELGSAVDLILDGGRLDGAESTVVRLTEEGTEVLRQGVVRLKEKSFR